MVLSAGSALAMIWSIDGPAAVPPKPPPLPVWPAPVHMRAERRLVAAAAAARPLHPLGEDQLRLVGRQRLGDRARLEHQAGLPAAGPEPGGHRTVRGEQVHHPHGHRLGLGPPAEHRHERRQGCCHAGADTRGPCTQETSARNRVHLHGSAHFRSSGKRLRNPGEAAIAIMTSGMRPVRPIAASPAAMMSGVPITLGPAEGVAEHLLGEAAAHLLGGGQLAHQLQGVLHRPVAGLGALQLAGGVHRLAAVVGPERADAVVDLERHAQRIEQRVAGGAGWILAVLLEAHPGGDVGIGRRDVAVRARRWRRRHLAQQAARTPPRRGRWASSGWRARTWPAPRPASARPRAARPGGRPSSGSSRPRPRPSAARRWGSAAPGCRRCGW